MPKLTREEKQFELNRHRDILSATIDYILQQTTSEDLLKDQFDVVAGFYEQQKQQIEKYFQKHRLDKLQQRLHNLTMFPMRRVDLTFNDYIKGKTGYEIDIFERDENFQMMKGCRQHGAWLYGGLTNKFSTSYRYSATYPANE